MLLLVVIFSCIIIIMYACSCFLFVKANFPQNKGFSFHSIQESSFDWLLSQSSTCQLNTSTFRIKQLFIHYSVCMLISWHFVTHPVFSETWEPTCSSTTASSVTASSRWPTQTLICFGFITSYVFKSHAELLQVKSEQTADMQTRGPRQRGNIPLQFSIETGDMIWIE